MATRRSFLATLGIGLFSAGAVWASPSGGTTLSVRTSDPVNTVRRFLAYRATNEWAKASALLFPLESPQPPFDQLLKIDPSAGDPFAKNLPPVLAAVSALFLDPRNRLGCQYQAIGTDPEDPQIVLVSALPHTTKGDAQVRPLLLRIVTAPDPQKGSLRIEVVSSYQKTDPLYFKRLAESVSRIASQSNLKQIVLAIIQYVQDHDEHHPPAATWVDAITPYLTVNLHTHKEQQRVIDSLFHDPSAPGSQRWSYAFNSNLGGLPLARLESPTTTVLVFESNAGIKNASDTGQSVPRPGRHSGGTDYAFADGHVKWVSDTLTDTQRNKMLSFSPTGN